MNAADMVLQSVDYPSLGKPDTHVSHSQLELEFGSTLVCCGNSNRSLWQRVPERDEQAGAVWWGHFKSPYQNWHQTAPPGCSRGFTHVQRVTLHTLMCGVGGVAFSEPEIFAQPKTECVAVHVLRLQRAWTHCAGRLQFSFARLSSNKTDEQRFTRVCYQCAFLWTANSWLNLNTPCALISNTCTEFIQAHQNMRYESVSQRHPHKHTPRAELTLLAGLNCL